MATRCPACNGRGRIEHQRERGGLFGKWRGLETITEECAACKGSGTVPENEPKVFGSSQTQGGKPTLLISPPHSRPWGDDEAGFTFYYPDAVDWTIRKPPEVKPPTRVAFANSTKSAIVAVAFIRLPTAIPDLSEPGILQRAVDDIFGAYRQQNTNAVLLSSRLIERTQGGRLKGVQLLYSAPIAGRAWKGRHVTFFRGAKRYDVTLLAHENEFDRVNEDFYHMVMQTFALEPQAE